MFIRESDQSAARAIAEMASTNPFSARRLELERRALGPHAEPQDAPLWSYRGAGDKEGRPNVARIAALCERITCGARDALVSGYAASEDELRTYEDLALYLLFERHRSALDDVAALSDREPDEPAGSSDWARFKRDFEDLLLPGGRTLPSAYRPAHVYSVLFQIRRSFMNIFGSLIGVSRPAGRLRESIWESIFTHDLRLYFQGLHERMADFATLITGESGTGKELVAGAVGRSRYLAFNPVARRFKPQTAGAFTPVNLSALSPSLIESELFGHRKGAFTGASGDRVGYFESCPAHGAVFLDEIGELDGSIQVKLLRLLQDRTFVRIGDVRARTFSGKIIAATNRDLAGAMEQGTFRADLYYRLCSDVLRAPPLREQFSDAPGDLAAMIRFVTDRLLPDRPALSEETAARCHTLVVKQLGEAYGWPGNFRELEQCVRNMIVRGRYEPAGAGGDGIGAHLGDIRCTADELLNAYCAATHKRLGSYVAAAASLGLDRRTVKARAEQAALG